jgi:hypothetical protein
VVPRRIGARRGSRPGRRIVKNHRSTPCSARRVRRGSARRRVQPLRRS